MAYTRTTWSDYPATTTPITATALNNIEAGIVALDRQYGVYATEAARDSAIGSPTEGMVAYITSPTVPAATGEFAGTPSGITTVYNGTSWVTTTPVSARTTSAGSTTSGSYTSTLSGSPGTNPSVTLTTGTTALVTISVYCYANIAGAGPITSFAVSGASTIAALDAFSATFDPSTGNYGNTVSYTGIVSGLTAGANTFTMQYRAGSNTCTFARRSITVQGIA